MFTSRTMLLSVFRGDETIIAKGDVQIQAGDTVVIFALQNAVKKVIKYFQ